MEVSPTTPTTQPTGLGAPGGSALGKEEFLQLLVAQLSNQDPLNPLEGQEFAAQLAQFSSVEALLNIESALGENASLSALIAQSTNSGVAAGLIGKTVSATGSDVNWNGSDETSVNFDLDSSADTVTVRILTSSGVVVRTIELSGLEAGENNVAWDGKTDAGDVADSGAYTFEASAKGFEGEDVSVTTHTHGVVDRVSFTSDGIVLWIGDVSLKMSDITSVGQ